VVTLGIDREMKRKIKRHAIRASHAAKANILGEVERREHEEALQFLKRMKEILRKEGKKSRPTY
jgi:hypothetical protein